MRGYSLIESLVAISLLGLITGLMARSTQLQSTQLFEVSRSLEQRVAITTAASTIAAALTTLERTRRSELVVLSNGSTLKAPHGGPHPLIGMRAASRPRPQSDVLSILDLHPLYQSRIVESQTTHHGATVTVCGVPSFPSPERFKSHLLLGISGACQVTGEAQPKSQDCFTLVGSAVRGLLQSETSCPPGSYHEWVPVMRELSLFIDSTGEFRLVSHVGMRIVENQPLTRGLRELTLRRRLPNQNAPFLEAQIRSNSGAKLKFIFPSGLTTSPPWNEILL